MSVGNIINSLVEFRIFQTLNHEIKNYVRSIYLISLLLKNTFMKLYIVQRYIIFFFSKTVDENNCKLRTKRFRRKLDNGMENFSKSWQDFAFVYSHGLSFHDTFVRIFYNQSARNRGKRLKGISRSRSTIYYRSNRGNIFFSRINVNTRW